MFLPATLRRLFPRLPLAPWDRRARAFTLIELLIVVGIIVIITGLAVPAFNAIRGGTDFTSEVYNVTGALDQARAYAMANNTFVLAGITEVSAAQDTSITPQASGTGRIAIAIIASKNGARPYQSLFYPDELSTWQSYYSNGSAFFAVSTLMTFQNIHLVDLQALTSGSGSMARPPVPPDYNLSNANGVSSTSFTWPLGTSFTTPPKYAFNKVIEFDPQGSARMISSANTASYPEAVPLYLEIGLQATHGAAAGIPLTGGTTGEIAAIQLAGITGASHIYRP